LGSGWYDEIQCALASAKVAILLVSADFLSSDFVLNEEVPRLLDRRHSEGLYVIPIVITPCPWQHVEWLKKMQLYLFRGKALSAGSPYQIDDLLARLVTTIIECLRGKLMGLSSRRSGDAHLAIRVIEHLHQHEFNVEATHSGVIERQLRIVVADDHAVVRHGLTQFIQQEDDMEVVGQADGGHSAVELAIELLPDIVLMDIEMPDLNGIEATREIHRTARSVRVIGLSMHSERRYVIGMFRAGASGYLMSHCFEEEMLRALRTVAEGKIYLSPSISGVVVESILHPEEQTEPALSALTQREQEVLQLIGKGMSAEQIAAQLLISPRTVGFYLLRIMKKLDIGNVAQLAEYAGKEGRISPEL
jgi:DNA-binding NarL/FixJ family response regulator